MPRDDSPSEQESMSMQESNRDSAPPIRPLRLRTLWLVVKAAGLVPMTIAFAILFAASSLVIASFEPHMATVSDAAWFLFTVFTTIGLGDYTCVTLAGRLATVLVSLYSVFYLALITGAIVSYCNERMKAHKDQSVAAFMDQLRHLPELSHDELVEISKRVKRM